VSAPARKPPNAGKGRPKGVPNKATATVREAIALLARNNIGKLEGWLQRIAMSDPAKAADILLRTIEYHIPKLARTEVSGLDGGPIATKREDLTDDELQQVILQRQKT
jgi:hypothetical protein